MARGSAIAVIARGKGDAAGFLTEGAFDGAIGVKLIHGTINVRIEDGDGRHRRPFGAHQCLAARDRKGAPIRFCRCNVNGHDGWVIGWWPHPDDGSPPTHTTFEVVSDHFVPGVDPGSRVPFVWDPDDLTT